MKVLLAISLTILSSAYGDKNCDDTLPDGTVCGPTDYVAVADPSSCWKYYECDSGCVTHKTCEDDYKFDIAYAWCTFPYDVDCGDRPCEDETHCPPERTTTTPEPDCTPEDQVIDCSETGAGYFPDEYNCRFYWHCNKGESKGEHIICPNDENGNPEMFDTNYRGCNFAEYTNCDGRPICDECNVNCQDTSTSGPDCTPPEQQISCKDVGAGWFPDKFNCRRYWHCLNENTEPEHILCPDDDKGNPEMFDPVYNGCNFASLTDCGERPVCDECNANCEAPTPPGPIDCGHDLDCSSKEDGWYADSYSCLKYWNCLNGTGYHYMCPEGLFYFPSTVQCDYPNKLPCSSNRPPCNDCDDGCP